MKHYDVYTADNEDPRIIGETLESLEKEYQEITVQEKLADLNQATNQWMKYATWMSQHNLELLHKVETLENDLKEWKNVATEWQGLAEKYSHELDERDETENEMENTIEMLKEEIEHWKRQCEINKGHRSCYVTANGFAFDNVMENVKRDHR